MSTTENCKYSQFKLLQSRFSLYTKITAKSCFPFFAHSLKKCVCIIFYKRGFRHNVITTGLRLHHEVNLCISFVYWVKKVRSLCLTNQALRHEGVWGSGCIDPHFLDLGTNWRWVVNFTPRPLYTWGKNHPCPLDRGCVNPGAGLDDLEKILPRFEVPPVGRPARRQSLYRLSYAGSSHAFSRFR
jgi:hypothetical protein